MNLRRITYTVYIEAINETLGPSVPDSKVLWKYGMDSMPENRDPSYPFATEHKKATKMAK